MAEKDKKIEDTENLSEFKADHSESEIADPVSKGTNKRPADKKEGGDKTPDKLSRAEIMKNMMYQAAKMDYNSLVSGHGKFTSVFDGDAKDVSKANMATITTKEDMDDLFGGNEELTEEFKEKAHVIFEASVNAKVIAETARIEEEFEAKLEEGVAEKLSELEEQVDSYLSAVVEQWMEDNALAIETSVKVDVMENFLSGLKDLFEDHYVSVPEDSVDAIDALIEQIEEYEGRLNEEIEKRIELQKELIEAKVCDAANELFEGLTITDQEKLDRLFEGIEFNTAEEFEEKATIIAENYLGKGVKRVSEDHLLTEELEIHADDVEKPVVDSQMAKYTSAVSRTVKR